MPEWEMGGYLPLELGDNGAYYDFVDESLIQKLHSGRCAIWAAAKNLTHNKIYLPSWYCETVSEMLVASGFTVRRYKIGEDWLPLDFHPEIDASVVLVNYFGIMGRRIKETADQFESVILDQSHAFFETPIFRDGLMNIYSCRKFFGVADGAYLIGKGLRKQKLPRAVSWPKSGFLLRSLEEGTNSAYIEQKKNEATLAGAYLSMSYMTEKIMRSIDYCAVAKKRRSNFRFLRERLDRYQLIANMDDNSVPYSYPFLLNKDCHALMLKKRIYVPYIWKEYLGNEWEGSLEKSLSENLHLLPLDQRYNEDDLERMVKIVESEIMNPQ